MYLIVEDKIKEAIENGDFDDLPGKGKKLDLRDELPGLSPELNQAYKMLKNAGFVPEENEDKKTGESTTSGDLLTYATGETQNSKAQKQKEAEAFVQKRKLHHNSAYQTYRQKILKRLSRG
ncbi:DUF1992 domain-containing protein [Lentibacillus cibarius]|uniref:DUF1992 domain-containing protein n=1 Tax=Lentibacillus cibarius TaxID=2583219 RepID=A0A549YH74_9BACI|nr:DUF1992 domain-containing protein [Lentibacillus cibarius]TRM11232.1 DUF1992 domain-containing protein [Lentibacillus cibarius]